MKKVTLLIFLTFCSFIGISSTSAWESNITIECINENLDPCSSSDISSNTSNENSDIDLIKPVKKKKEVAKEKTNKKQKKVIKKKTKKNKKKIAKKEKKDISLKTSSNKSNTNYDFDSDISFEEFKVLVINYTNNSDFPDINN